MNQDAYELKYRREAWMSADQWACAKLVADASGGFHNVDGDFKPCGYGIEVNVFAGDLSTFDTDRLTRLVLLAHDRCIRIELGASSPRRVKLRLHQRHVRAGSSMKRHPTIEEALAVHRRFFPAPPDAPSVPVDELRELVAREYLTVEPFGIPTGQGDADVGWRIYQAQIGGGREVVAEVFEDDLHAAMRAAESALVARQKENGRG